MAYICIEGNNLYRNNDGENNKPRIREISTVLIQKPMQIVNTNLPDDEATVC